MKSDNGKMTIAQLKDDPSNPRDIDDESLKALSISLDEFGDISGIVYNLKTKELVCGHQRKKALVEQYGDKAALKVNAKGTPTAIVTPDESFPIRAVDWTRKKQQLANIAANSVLIAGRFTPGVIDILKDIETDFPELYTDLKLDGLIDTLDFSILDEPQDGLTDPDDIPGVPEDAISKPGDLWILGDHRLLCGDCTKAEDVARVMGGEKAGAIVADPPYGMCLDTDYSKMPKGSKAAMVTVTGKVWEPIVGDDKPFNARAVLSLIDPNEQFWFGADYYRRTLSDDDADGSWLVWDKRNAQTDVAIGSGFELCWSKQPHKRDLLRYYFNGALGSEAANRMHPAQKPTALLSEIIQRWTKDDHIIYDPFSGSGTIIIAAEQLNRKCYAIEIEPKYVDVAVKRWEQFTGKEAVKG